MLMSIGAGEKATVCVCEGRKQVALISGDKFKTKSEARQLQTVRLIVFLFPTFAVCAFLHADRDRSKAAAIKIARKRRKRADFVREIKSFASARAAACRHVASVVV